MGMFMGLYVAILMDITRELYVASIDAIDKGAFSY
jgi:hypothetical protein